jgi:photosystem II stability/assembly factor-like uncharacterized protein
MPRGFRGLFKTADGGSTWSPANDGLQQLAQIGAIVVGMAVDSIRRGTAYAATSGDGVYKTTDGGATWSRFNDGLGSLDVRALLIADDGIYAATAAGVFRSTLESAPGVSR